jgi:hypothetical protein
LLPCVGNQVGLFFFGHLLLEPILKALVMDVPHRSITLATIEQWVLRSRGIVPTHFALDIWASLWVDYSTINFYSFLFKLISKRVKRMVMVHALFLRSLLYLWVFNLIELSPVVFNIEFDSTKLDDVSTT